MTSPISSLTSKTRCKSVAALLLSAVLLGGAQIEPARAGGDKAPRPDRFIVQLDPASTTSIEQLNAEYNTITERALVGVRKGFVIRARVAANAKSILEKLAKDKRLRIVDGDSAVMTIGANPARSGTWGQPTPPDYLNQDATRVLNLSQAQRFGRGAGVIVAVIDTGVSPHPDLAANLLPGYDFVDGDSDPADARNGLDDNGDGRIDEVYGHGTHVAGVIKLVAPEAKIMPLRALDADGRGLMLDVAQAFAYAMDNGAHVINLSLGSNVPSRLLEDLVNQAAARNIVVVASAGNLADDAEQYPAASACAIGVISVNVADSLSPFSNFGKWVDFSAPGEAIYSTFPPNGYAHWSGTSMATPFVAGQAALLRGIAPSMPLRTLVHAIDISATDLAKNKAVKSDHLGMGRIDVGASAALVASGNVSMSGQKKIKGGC
jgi:thermitase